MAGASDISTILSNSGRIERINPNTFAQHDAARQVLTEGEARERMRRNRSVNEGKQSQTIVTSERQRRSPDEQQGEKREATSGTRTSFESFLRTHGVEPSALNVGMELGSTQAIKEAVKVGLGIAPISSLAVAEEVSRGEFQLLALAEGPMKRSFSLITNPDKFQTYTTEKFLQFVFQQLRA